MTCFSFLTDALVERASILNSVNSFSSASASEAEINGISVTLLKILLNGVLTGDEGVSLPLRPGEAGGSLWTIVGDEGGWACRIIDRVCTPVLSGRL